MKVRVVSIFMRSHAEHCGYKVGDVFEVDREVYCGYYVKTLRKNDCFLSTEEVEILNVVECKHICVGCKGRCDLWEKGDV